LQPVSSICDNAYDSVIFYKEFDGLPFLSSFTPALPELISSFNFVIRKLLSVFKCLVTDKYYKANTEKSNTIFKNF